MKLDKAIDLDKEWGGEGWAVWAGDKRNAWYPVQRHAGRYTSHMSELMSETAWTHARIDAYASDNWEPKTPEPAEAEWERLAEEGDGHE